ncbi:CBN-CZW-1 protein [Caenorhabditis brenneri]|uniref:CBN-CZW-1 protein n=1 Tax=Caenorhabditis brenneri TaxID=135651 RepID=G0NG50_CAEBE|nr:CBN-CZW-1 protein [Caenorhabditis brenneri]
MRSSEGSYRDLEKKLKDGLTSISADIFDKYGNLKVALNINATAKLIFDRLENLEDLAEMSARDLGTFIEKIEKDSPEMLTEVKSQAKSCENLLEFLQSMKKVEEQLIIMRSKTTNRIEWGNAILACKDYLNDTNSLLEGIQCEGFDMSTPLKHFSDEYSVLSYNCRYQLSADYDRAMSIPKVSKKQGSDKSNISFTVLNGFTTEEQKNLNETLTAMNMIGQLPERLDAWKTVILDVFCDAIISSRDGVDVFVVDNPTPDQTRFLINQKPRSKKYKSMDVHKVLESLDTFFSELAEVLKTHELLDACGRTFMSMIGSTIQSRLITMVLENVIAIAAPVTETADEDQDNFINLLKTGEEFVVKMKSLGFFAPNAKLLFELNTDTIFVTRRCYAIVSRANKLVNETYDKLVTVGVEDSAVKDIDLLAKAHSHAEKYAKEYGNDLARLWNHNEESQFPSYFAFQKCTVSASTISFVNLLRDNVKAAFASEDEGARAKLALTAQNIVRLYIIQSPRKHAELFSSIPNMAAIFYNNCHYISHCIMTMSFEAQNDNQKTLLEPLLIDSVIRLRSVAADCMEKTLTRCRREMSVYLEDHSIFEHLPVSYKTTKNTFAPQEEMSEVTEVLVPKEEPKLIKCLAACLLHIRLIAKNLREPLTEVVYCKVIGSLISFLLDSLVRHVVTTSDFRENDANVMADVFKKLLEVVANIVTYQEQSKVTDFCAREYFRLNEIVFVLGNRMQDIEHRWFNAKGPMAEHLSRSEVVGLIKALFSDTQNRNDLIARL